MKERVLRLSGTSLVVVLVLVCLLATCPLWGQSPTPFLLFGFEGTEGLQGWTRLPCQSTSVHFSQGSSAMQFTFSNWTTSGVEYPLILCDYNNGQNYAIKDWSGYATISFDVWVDGSQPLNLALELHNTLGVIREATHFTVQPGVMNTCTVTLADEAGLDLTNVQQILLFTYRPTQDYVVTVDNFQLTPLQKPPIAEFDLLYPNYRNTIFTDGKSLKVSTTVHAADYGLNQSDLSVLMTAKCGKSSFSNRAALTSGTGTTTISTGLIPLGVVNLLARVINNKTGGVLISQSWTLTKKSTKAIATTPVYIDSNNNTIVNGQPFFPIGWYGSTSTQQLAEIANSPFNCLLAYATNQQPKAYMNSFLDSMQQYGLKLIYGMNDVYPSATYLQGLSWEGLTGNDAIAAGVITAYKNHPAILAWYLIDEPAKSLASEIEGYYQRVKSLDPGHPCYSVIANMPYVKYFSDSCDAMGVDPYPIPMSPISQVADQADAGYAGVNGHKPVWLVPQAFAWYQFTSTNPDRGHIPTADELLTGRAPNCQEERCMTYLALTHGAKGLIYYCYYDLRVLPQYTDMWDWMKSIAGEVKTLSPMLLSTTDLGAVAYTPTSAHIHTKLKRSNGHLYLMAVNSDNAPYTVTFNVNQPLLAQASVMFENRSVGTSGTQLTDSFQPLEAHVYDFGALP